MPTSPDSPLERRVAVVAVLLRPALTAARLLGLSLDDLRELLDTGYIRELQGRGQS